MFDNEGTYAELTDRIWKERHRMSAKGKGLVCMVLLLGLVSLGLSESVYTDNSEGNVRYITMSDMKRSENALSCSTVSTIGLEFCTSIAPTHRVIPTMTLTRPERILEVSAKEEEILQRIVEAEAGGEDADGKLLVANVVLNRVKAEGFPDTIEEVVFQRSKKGAQFSPVANGRYDKVIVSDASKEAVERALCGEDISQGALFFAARKYANPRKMKWFDDSLTFLFSHGGHEFFK